MISALHSYFLSWRQTHLRLAISLLLSSGLALEGLWQLFQKKQTAVIANLLSEGIYSQPT